MLEVHYIMSIRPVFGEQILSGEKSHEVRKYFGLLEPGSWVLLYFSSPVKAFMGLFRVRNSFRTSEEEVLHLLPTFRGYSDLDLPYIRGRRTLIVIEVGETIRFRRPVPLSEVRGRYPNFRPPLSYVRVRGLLQEVCRYVLEEGLGETE